MRRMRTLIRPLVGLLLVSLALVAPTYSQGRQGTQAPRQPPAAPCAQFCRFDRALVGLVANAERIGLINDTPCT